MEASLGELTPIDLEGKTVKEALSVLSGAIYQTHSCVEDVGKQVSAIEGELKGIAVGLNLRRPEPGETAPKAKTQASWQTRIAAVGGSIAGIAALYQFIHAIWPAVSAYLLSVK